MKKKIKKLTLKTKIPNYGLACSSGKVRIDGKITLKTKPKKRWKPKQGECYWINSSVGYVYYQDWDYHPNDIKHYNFGNCFKTKAEAKAAAKKVKALLRSL